MRHRVRLFFAALTMHLAVGLCAQAPVLELPCTADSWKADVRGKSAVGFDRREICRINHPWEMSAAGDYGEISRMVTIPKDWKPPYWLRWYASDNYVAEGVDHSNLKEGGGYLLMIGHRFKQVLVDDNVVWERNVADPILPGPKARPSEPAGSDAPFPPYFTVDISSQASAGKPFKLTLRVYDKVASTTRLEKDFIAEYRFHDKPVEMENAIFSTDVYWADVTVHQGAKPPVTDVPPSWKLGINPVKMSRAVRPATQQSVPMSVERADLLDGTTFPVSSGVPFPEGAVHALNLSVTDPDGQKLPAQGQPFLFWPDGSVKWARVDLLARRPRNVTGPWMLNVRTESAAPPAHRIQVTEASDAFTVDTGVIRFVIRRTGEHLVDSVTIAGQQEPISSAIDNSIAAILPMPEAVTYKLASLLARKESVTVESAGPLRATLRLSGHITDGDLVLGRFVTRIDAFAGQAYVKMTHRIFNDYPAQSVRIRDFKIKIPVAARRPQEATKAKATVPGIYGRGRQPEGIFCRFGNEAAKAISEVDELGLIQAEVDRYVLWNIDPLNPGKPQEQAKGWGAYWGYRGGVAAFVRDFWQQYPQGLSIGKQSLWLRLFANCAQQQYYEPTQGEAKRMEIWFNFFPGEFSADTMDRFNSLVQRPPRLFSARWVRTSGGLGLAPEDPEHTLPDLYKALTRGAPWNPAIVARDGTTGYGLRNWGDRFFLTQWDRGGYGTAWSNNYYDSIFKSALAYVLAGDPTRFEEAQVLANHYMDIDICHYRFQQPDQAGADYILSFDHTGTLSRPTGRPFVQGLVTMGLLAADPDYLETASLMADRVVALTKETGGKIGMRCDHPRVAGFPLEALMEVYVVNPKPAYLDAAKNLLHWTGQCTDPRRGAQMCNLSGYVTIGYSEGQTAWSAMAYYRATQDSLGGHRVLGLAEADMHEPGGPATWKPYGHLESEAAMYVYASALTGDETYLPHAVTSMTAFKKGWMPQKNLEVMYWLERTESRHPAR